MTVKDQDKRSKALDPTTSFIVQAPAGSGKTELLTQRFLVLLAMVPKAPEEVVAITFTRKAATEMRTRILNAFYAAKTEKPPIEAHALKTWQLARKVLERDEQDNWNLLSNPNRLRILTIDALCARIAKSSPLLSNFGTAPNVVENAHPYYLQAAHRLLNSLDENEPFINSLKTLLLHLDNNYALVENLFVGMLSRRDQWLSHIMTHRGSIDSKEILETGLQNVICDTLDKTLKLFSNEDKAELLALANFAGNMLRDAEKDSPIIAFESTTQFPSKEISNLNLWFAIAELLLTKSFEWRRTVNKNCGFPAAGEALNPEEALLFKHMKERMCTFLSKINEHDSLRIALKEILLLPSPIYSDKQWQIVSALTDLLPVLAAYLNIVFSEHNVTDFIAITQGAIQSLGEWDNPSETALNLDYQIKHLLVDEFQDTSTTQYKLLELLTVGWEKNDGRTLFLVGDPMQSIYRFREAEVGIYLKVKKYGLTNVNLIPLTLEVNFRSKLPIVNWFNETFKLVFPEKENIELGAISFTPSIAFSQKAENSFVQVHPFFNPNENEEAAHLTQLIKNELENDPNQSIAVLVRSRSHLLQIIPELKKANVNFQAIEIEKLIYSPVVQDLFSLTKALSHVGDRIAWLAVLRAPWCGLCLGDLYAIVNKNKAATLWENLNDFKQIEALTGDGVERINQILPVLTNAINERSRGNLRAYLTHTWHALGGPACLQETYEIENAATYLKLLDHFVDQSSIDFTLLQQKLSNAYSYCAPTEANIHLMTIHKAKGLEFDTVIIPSLEKRPAIDESQLLLWLERQNSKGTSDLILAPIRSLEEDFDSIYRFVRTQITLKNNYEISRLLYVAITRAKARLHLLGSIYSSEQDEEKFKIPSTGSFLNFLWPKVKTQFENMNDHISSSSSSPAATTPTLFLTRLSKNWVDTFIPPSIENNVPTLATSSFIPDAEYRNHVGTLIHRFLQIVSENNQLLEKYNLEEEIPRWEKKLLQLGVSDHLLNECIKLIQKAITNIKNDDRSKWILSDQHLNAKSEYPLTVYIDDTIKHYIIDRTFIDEQGNRWIIDYKNTESFTEEETFFIAKAKMKYASQLENYARIMKLIDERPIKLGLYFPLFQGWCEWDFRG